MGGCGGGLSREHIISRSQFDGDTVTVEGFTWCPEPKTVGISSLVAKNLCRNHNEELSPVDKEAKRFRIALRDINFDPRILPIRAVFDARLLERWLLKTSINLSLQENGTNLQLNDELVSRAFGRTVPPLGQGFFTVVELGEKLRLRQGVRFEATLRKMDSQMVIGVFVFHGMRLIYAFDGAPAVQGAMRLRRINSTGRNSLEFRWNPDFSPADLNMQDGTSM